MTRPLPEHGTYARANGSPGRRGPCSCGKCRPVRLKARKKYRVQRAQGRPGRIDATPAREHLNLLHQTMSWAQIADATSTDERNLQLIASGQHQSVRRDTLAKIQAVAPQPMTARGMYVDSLASQRRVQSLCALGHSMLVIANAAGTTQKRIQLISSGRQASVRHHIAIRLLATYRELSEITPKPGRSSTRTRRGAAEKGWAPPAAWDDDSIDDPEAHPDWTGFCGSDRGWWTHRLEQIPVCPRCQAAHDEWLQAHQGLSHGERFKALGRAKAEASNRGAAIVENARELMRLGASYETAAQRLGITRQHLQQELIRHPEPAAAA